MGALKIRHVVERGGRLYWQTTKKMRDRGLTAEVLPLDIGEAVTRAQELNEIWDHMRDERRQVENPKPCDDASLYVVASSRAVKIGYGLQPWDRLAALQVGSHDELALVFMIRPERVSARALEKAVHDRLRHKSLRGEWFAVTARHAIRCIMEMVDRLDGAEAPESE
jgi:hypothetical protein